MDQLPPGLLSAAAAVEGPFDVVVVVGVLGEVLPQGANQDHDDEAGQEQHHHEAVEDAEPVDLHIHAT